MKNNDQPKLPVEIEFIEMKRTEALHRIRVNKELISSELRWFYRNNQNVYTKFVIIYYSSYHR